MQQEIGYDARPQHVVVDDFNADHHVEMAVADIGSDTIDLFLGNGNGTFQQQIPHSLASQFRPPSLVQADFNHDHHLSTWLVPPLVDHGF